ncbi:Gastrin-releasing peptide receptor [Holothuria leucospilota]|uniref:Gastrin-releasing peptide receptor n=1 Tax=Holothuria leucospilota TaxID=206669 RepID=A0A9Q1H000_HOLLE|nr:Gastrin-releasing peptide receptor [Holothuria leucospilota]
MENEKYFVGVDNDSIVDLSINTNLNDGIIHPSSSYYIATLSVFFLVGVFGNLSLIWLFVKEARLHDVSHALISNLAFSDFLCMLVYVPTLIYADVHRLRPFGKYFCYLFTTLTYTSHDVSILSFVALSYVRYRVILHPLSTLGKHAKYKTLVFCVFSWIIGIGFSILPASHCEEHTVRVEVNNQFNSSRLIKQHYIYMDSKDWRTYLPLRFVLLYVIPLLIITVLHCQMAKKLIMDSSILKTNPSISARKALSSRKRLGVIMILLILSFALCWFPNYVVLYMVFFTTIVNIPQVLIRLRPALISLSLAINPVILYITSSTHRHFLRKQFTDCSQGKSLARWSIGTRSSTISSRDSNSKKLKKVNVDGLGLQAVQTVTTCQKVSTNYQSPG